MEKLQYSWDDFFGDAKQLAKRVQGNNFDTLLVLTKGGLFLGSYLSEYLNIEIVETFGIKSYKDQNRDALRIVKQAKLNLSPKLLIVDDIVDSGETLNYVHDLYKASSVVLFAKPTSVIKPTWQAREVTNEWVVFPWERLHE